MRTENFLGKRAGYSDRIKGGSGLVDRIMTPIEEMEGWDSALIEKEYLRLRALAERGT
jgi:hypothetical protein